MSAHRSKKKVAVLDDYAGIARKHFDSIPNVDVSYYDQTRNAASESGLQALIQRLEPYEIISSMRERTAFPPALLSALPNLKLLLTTAMRNNSIHLPAATQHHIIVTGTHGSRQPESHYHDKSYAPPPPDSGPSSVIQHSWALLLSLCSKITEHHNLLQDPTRREAWQAGAVVSLAGKTLGLLGLGKLGSQFGGIAVQSFGMKVVAWSANLTQDKADAQAESVGLPRGTFTAVRSKRELCERSDVLSIHMVLSERSRGIVGREELGGMKQGAILLNTSRGGLVDEDALIDCLKGGRIAGFATDVFWEEPLGRESVWRRVGQWSRSQVLLSPHMACVNEGTMNRWYEEQVEILEQYLKGEELKNRLN